MPVNYDQFRGNFRSVVVITETVPGIAGLYSFHRESGNIFICSSKIRRGEGGATVIYLATLWFLFHLKITFIVGRTIFYMFSFVKHCNKTQLTLHRGIMKASNNDNAQRTFTLYNTARPCVRSGQIQWSFINPSMAVITVILKN